jgi:hypothetical protein
MGRYKLDWPGSEWGQVKGYFEHDMYFWLP